MGQYSVSMLCPAPCFRNTCCANIPGALVMPYMCIDVELNELHSATPRMIISPWIVAADYLRVTNEVTILTRETSCFSYLIRERTRCLGRGAEPQRDKVRVVRHQVHGRARTFLVGVSALARGSPSRKSCGSACRRVLFAVRVWTLRCHGVCCEGDCRIQARAWLGVRVRSTRCSGSMQLCQRYWYLHWR
jgi:hypothetical protein